MNKYFFYFVIVFLFLFGCKKNPTSNNDDSSNDNSLITIEWSSSYQVTFTSSVQNVHRSFTVTSGSGNFKITAEVTSGDGNKKSFTGPVEEGEKYYLTVPVTMSATTKSCTPNVTASRITLSGGNGPSTSLSFACGNNGRAAKTLTIGELTF